MYQRLLVCLTLIVTIDKNINALHHKHVYILKNLLSIFLATICHFSYSQVQIEDFIRSSLSVEAGDAEIRNKTIINKPGSYSDPSQGELDFLPVNLLLTDIPKDSANRYQINGDLTFINCTFPETFIFSEFHISGILRFEKCSFPEGILLRNTRASEVQFSENRIENLHVEKLHCDKFSMEFDEADWIDIKGSTFTSSVFMDIQTTVESLNLENSSFSAPKPTVLLDHPDLFNHGKPTEGVFIGVNAQNIVIGGNQFKALSEFDIFSFVFSEAKVITMIGNECQGLLALSGKCDFIRMFGNTLNKFDIHGFSIPEFETSIEWENISGRLANFWTRGRPEDYNLADSLISEYKIQMNVRIEDEVWVPQFYFGESQRELVDKWFFDHLIGDYYRIYQSYKVNGRIEDANSIYVEMNDLYGRRLGAIYRQEPTFRRFMKWKLNQLLKLYTEHGTEPIKAVIISFYLIIFFGIFYFFFPSEWDAYEWNREKWRQLGFKKTSGTLFSHLLNSMILSLNAFVTLGFGRIPTTGIPRYVCIIQGFMGWFLLSLFTVALINQTLF